MTNIPMQYARTDFDINFTLETEIKYGIMRSSDKGIAQKVVCSSLIFTSMFSALYFWCPSLHSSPSEMSMTCCRHLAAGFTWPTTDKQHKPSWKVKGMLPISPVTNTLAKQLCCLWLG